MNRIKKIPKSYLLFLALALILSTVSTVFVAQSSLWHLINPFVSISVLTISVTGFIYVSIVSHEYLKLSNNEQKLLRKINE